MPELSAKDERHRQRRLKSANGIASRNGFILFRWLIFNFAMLFMKPELYNAERIPPYGRNTLQWYPRPYRRTDPNDGPVGEPFILTANHGSVFDIPFVGMVHRPMVWVAKPWFCANWLLAMLFQRMGAVPVFRPSVDGDLSRKGNSPERIRKYLRLSYQPAEMMQVALAALKRGFPVQMYPEGSRVGRSEVDGSRSGAARLACAAGVPIVPIGIVGCAKGDPVVRTRLLRRRVMIGIVGQEIHPGDYVEAYKDQRERERAMMNDWQEQVNQLRKQALELLESYPQR